VYPHVFPPGPFSMFNDENVPSNMNRVFYIYIYIKPRREKKEKTMRILYKHETSRKKLKWLVNTCMIYDYLFILNQIKCRSFLWMHVNISNEKLKKIRYVVVNCRIKNERLAHNCKLLDIKYPQDAS
jgi:hypothetical protein